MMELQLLVASALTLIGMVLGLFGGDRWFKAGELSLQGAIITLLFYIATK